MFLKHLIQNKKKLWARKQVFALYMNKNSMAQTHCDESNYIPQASMAMC